MTGGSAAGGASAGNGGAGGASAGSGGSASGSGGSAGSGGAGNSTLPKRVLLYHFSTLVIPSVPAQITLLKTQLTTWGYEVEDSVKPEDLSATNLARFGGVGMINTCFEPFGTGKTGEAQTAALKPSSKTAAGCSAPTARASPSKAPNRPTLTMA